MFRFFLLSTLISLGYGGYMLGVSLDKVNNASGPGMSNAQLCASQVQYGFNGIQRSLTSNQLQIQTLTFCMQAASAPDNPQIKSQIDALNAQYLALEGAKTRSPLTFLVDEKTYQLLNKEAKRSISQ